MLRPSETALIIVDMQNAYASPGGYLDLAGFDISGAAPAIEKIGEAAAAARAAGMPVIFFQNGWDPDYVEAGGPGSPNWHKSNALKTMRNKPELQGKLLAKGGWDYELVQALPPQPGDIVVAKPRYSAFFNTNLDSLLRARGIRSLVFTGIATNVCVESTLRDGFFLEYFGVVLHDATHHAGTRLHPAGLALQHREVLRLGVLGRGVPHGLAGQHQSDADNEGRVLMPMKAIFPPGSGKTLAPYSPGAMADGIVYVAGTLALDAETNVVHVGDAAAQTEYVLNAIKSVIETAGGTMADVTFNSIFITDWANYAAINGVYAKFFPGDKPARYCIQCGLVKKEALVEIATVAHVGKKADRKGTSFARLAVIPSAARDL